MLPQHLLIISLTVVAVVMGHNAKFSTKIGLHSERNCLGSYISIQSIIRNLEVLDFDNRALSASINGPFLLYGNRNFNEDGDAISEYVFGSHDCVNFKEIGGAVTSVMPVIHDYSKLTLNVYEEINFQGNLQQLVGSGHFRIDFKSLIITGGTPWTLYNTNDVFLEASGVCLRPDELANIEPVIIIDMLQFNSGFEQGRFNSARIGCHTTNILEIPAYIPDKGLYAGRTPFNSTLLLEPNLNLTKTFKPMISSIYAEMYNISEARFNVTLMSSDDD